MVKKLEPSRDGIQCLNRVFMIGSATTFLSCFVPVFIQTSFSAYLFTVLLTASITFILCSILTCAVTVIPDGELEDDEDCLFDDDACENKWSPDRVEYRALGEGRIVGPKSLSTHVFHYIEHELSRERELRALLVSKMLDLCDAKSKGVFDFDRTIKLDDVKDALARFASCA